MSKHTPGPWTAIMDNHEDSEGDWYVLAPNEDAIAVGLSKPDACLIAEAPDLLAVLKDLLVHAQATILTGWQDKELLARVRAAIAKAEGA